MSGAARRARRVVGLLAAVVLLTGTGGLVAWWHQGPSNPAGSGQGQGTAQEGSTPSSGAAGKARAGSCPSDQPCRIVVPELQVDTSMSGKPTELAWDPFLQQRVPSFGIPDDLATTTWWSSGPKPGASGMAIVLGHRNSGGYGVFNRLGDLEPGDRLTIDRGSWRLSFRVTDIVGPLVKTDPAALSGALERHAGTARLALISCTGAVNTTYQQIDANIVVFADLVDRATPPDS